MRECEWHTILQGLGHLQFYIRLALSETSGYFILDSRYMYIYQEIMLYSLLRLLTNINHLHLKRLNPATESLGPNHCHISDNHHHVSSTSLAVASPLLSRRIAATSGPT